MARNSNIENEEISVGQNPIERYQKPLIIVASALLVITLGYVGFNRLYLEPQQKVAAGEMFMAEKYFAKDSFELALMGLPTGQLAFAGFEDVASDYSMTDAGNMAHYYAGICHLHMGSNSKVQAEKENHFEEAITYLKKFSSESDVLGPLSLGGIGDAFSELGKYAEAAPYYEKAANASMNEYTAPVYLKKAGIIYEETGQFDKAVAAYKKIKDEYPESEVGTSIDKYISRATNRK